MNRLGGSNPLVGTFGQLGARGLAGRRLLFKEKIVGSNPTGSTTQANGLEVAKERLFFYNLIYLL